MTAIEQLATTLAPHGELRRGENLARHTTFGIGGPADLFLTVRSAGSLALATNAAHDAGVGVFILGSGSNILVADAGIRGLVIDTSRGRSPTARSKPEEVRPPAAPPARVATAMARPVPPAATASALDKHELDHARKSVAKAERIISQ